MYYAYLIGSLGLLLIWLSVWLSLKANADSRSAMLKVSLATSLLGLSEPLFVPAYWNPPTLFNLAQETGFDIESLIFSFAVGGITTAAYELLWKSHYNKIPTEARQHRRHRFHRWALSSAPIVFILLYLFTSFNPIYVTIMALFAGALVTFYCRPDLIKKMVSSGIIFLVIYFLFFVVFNVLFPDYTREVWNLNAISGVLVFNIPLEELLFAFSLGLMWSSVFEHVSWLRLEAAP